jgi:hypothetical protein
MSDDFAQVTVGGPAGTIAPATQLVTGDGEDVLLFNSSTVNTVYLTAQNAYTSTDAGTLRVTPLGPQQSVVFNGDKDVFGVCPLGTTAVVFCYPSATNYTPFNTTQSLFNTGNPGSGPYFTIPANTFNYQVFSGDVSRWNSYDLSLYAYGTPQNSGSAQALQISLSWYDVPYTTASPPSAIFVENWYCYIGTAKLTNDFNLMAANGPMHGQYMTVTITNIGSSPVSVDWFNLFASPRTVPYSDWRQDSSNLAAVNLLQLNGLSPALDTETAGTGFENILVSIPNQVFGTGLQFIPMPLYSGPVSMNWSVNTQALVNAPVLVALTTQTGGELVAGTACPGVIDSFSNTIGVQDRHSFNFPRAPVILIVNPGANSMIQFSAIAQQAA